MTNVYIDFIIKKNSLQITRTKTTQVVAEKKFNMICGGYMSEKF